MGVHVVCPPHARRRVRQRRNVGIMEARCWSAEMGAHVVCPPHARRRVRQRRNAGIMEARFDVRIDPQLVLER
ncbi:hypothetical protein WQ56_04440 [Luteimonas sp. FCS-9]|nr:hypothetical protein WQ56_04440 [Luteimonas sp. FCS-9]